MKSGLYIISLLILFCSCIDRQAKTEKSDNAFYEKAYQFREKGEKDSAFVYYNMAKEEFFLRKDSIKAGECIVNMAIISTDRGDFFGGQELSLDALSIFNKEKPEHHRILLSTYNNLGITSFNLKQYFKAIEFYNKSLEFISDTAIALIIKNNIANAYRKEKKFGAAIEIYQSILEQEKNAVNYARILSNYAYTKWLQNPDYNSTKELYQSLSIRLKEKDLWGQNASYAHLADYYLKKHPDSALFFSRKMYDVATKLNSSDDRLEALQKLIPLSEPRDSKEYFEVYRSLGDSLQIARNSAKNQFALIRYETEKHKADNLALQHQNTVRNLWNITLIILVIVGSGLSALWYKRRTRRLALEAKNALQESELKTSKKVHDIVANGIYRIMSEMEHVEKVDRAKTLDQLEVLYERSRDISYDHDPDIDHRQTFQDVISELLLSFASSDIKVVIAGNDNKIWEPLSHQSKNELKHVLQELMVNMRKHSKASSVALRFEKNDGSIWIHYKDNGIGISNDTTFKNGLSNTGTRINSIGGVVNFDSGPTGGLQVQIQIPAGTQ